MQLEVAKATDMHNIQYEVRLYSGRICAAMAGLETGCIVCAGCIQLKIPNSAPNVTAAFLVGRCLKEVECGDCPPRCETLMSTDRMPQFCTLPGSHAHSRHARPPPSRCMFHFAVPGMKMCSLSRCVGRPCVGSFKSMFSCCCSCCCSCVRPYAEYCPGCADEGCR